MLAHVYLAVMHKTAAGEKIRTAIISGWSSNARAYASPAILMGLAAVAVCACGVHRIGQTMGARS